MASGIAARIASSQTEAKRKIVDINKETVSNIAATDFPGHWPGESHEWNFQKFRDNFSVKFYQNDAREASFSLIGIDASIANAFRRTVISEVPTVAIEHLYIHNNTSVVQDEVLSQRLGLVPLTGSTEGFKWMKWIPPVKEGDNSEPELADYNTLVLRLDIECTKNPNAVRGEQDPKKAYYNSNVYARDITFHPVGRQEQLFAGEGAVHFANPDILLAKLRPGQKLDIEMHCVKGIGADHAKFSPVARASYRLLPQINILKPILGNDAVKFASCFPAGVIGLETVTAEEAAQKGSGYEGHEGEKKAVVVDPFEDTVSRECLRHDEFRGKVKLGRVRDHFIYNIESTGQYPSDMLFLDSVKVLKHKCQKLKEDLAKLADTTY